jgi:hypothetical protein
MFPIVSSLAPPTGHLLISILDAFRCNQNRSILLPKSNIASIPVARRENEIEDMAAYTRKATMIRLCRRTGRENRLCNRQRQKLAARLAQIAILTYCKVTGGEIIQACNTYRQPVDIFVGPRFVSMILHGFQQGSNELEIQSTSRATNGWH